MQACSWPARGWRSSRLCTRCRRSSGSFERGLSFVGVIARYREHLPVGPATPEIDLQEGSTPLVPSRNIGHALAPKHLYFQYEGLNPTGSFKDRGMVVAVAKALEAGSRGLVCGVRG